jgi:hypothetical protein
MLAKVAARRVVILAAGVVCAAGAAVCLGGCGDGLTGPVSVFPAPGSRLVTPQTEIVIRGVPASRIASVAVMGSRSGRHPGRVMGDSDHDGASFLPAKPFTAGEEVTVRARVRGLRQPIKPWHFVIEHPAGPLPRGGLPWAGRLPGDVVTLQSRPDLAPVALEIIKHSTHTATGDLFLTPQQGPVENGPMILSSSGQLVWFKPVPKGDMAANLQVQRYRGKPVLTWWQGYSGAGVGLGEDLIYNSSYRQVAVVHAANGLMADLHDFVLTPQGTALITAYNPVVWNTTSVHGPRRMVVLDSVIQEIDIKTGLLLFQWDSLAHIPLTDTYEPLPKNLNNPFDYFHINAVQQDRDGDLIVSARNTWAAYKINPRTGRVVWTLGGKRSNFKLSPGAQFAFQHDVRARSGDDRTITIFDDGAGPPRAHEQSRGLTLRLDLDRDIARVVRVDEHPPSLLADFEGNLQQLPNGDQLLGWGQQPYVTEFNSRGRVVFDARFVDGNSSYRAYRFPWAGTPSTAPAVVASTAGAATTLYVSWNGATGVRAWRILAGPNPGQLKAVGTVPWRGFETRIVMSAAQSLALQAIGRNGRVLSTSRTITPS